MPPRDSIASFRERYLNETVPRGYNGSLHVLRNTCLYAGVFLSGFLIAWYDASDAGWEPWWGFAFGLFLFNLVEYGFHRWISHRKRTLMPGAYRRHTGIHHPYFASPEAVVDSPRDLHAILLPTSLATLFVVVFSGALGIPLHLLQGQGAAGGFLAAIALSVFQLDFLHLYYHLPRSQIAARALSFIPYFQILRRLHQEHHAAAKPTTGFNITHPVTDALFGTLGQVSAQGACEGRS